MAVYVALIRKEGSHLGVEFPDLPGCISAAENLDDAYEQAREALALHIEGMVDDGEAIPPPSSLEDVLASDQCGAAYAVMLVLGPVVRQPSVRINVTMEKSLLDAVDRAAATYGLTRSGFLAHVTRRFLGIGG